MKAHTTISPVTNVTNLIFGPGSLSGSSALKIDAANKKIGYKFIADRTSPIISIDIRLNITGDMTGILLKASIQTDNNGIPSGTLVGDYTDTFAPPSSSNWTGLKSLLTNTGDLTINTPYWLVLEDGGGTAPTASNNVAGVFWNLANISGMIGRCYNGTNWTTVGIQVYDAIFINKHNDNSYFGTGIDTTLANSTRTAIYSTNRQGFKYSLGCSHNVKGIRLNLTKTGSPSSLDIEIYENDTLKTTITIPAITILSQTYLVIFTTSLVNIAAGADTYIILHQNGDGGNSSNYYTTRVYKPKSPYIETLVTAEQRQVAGTSSTPSSLTVYEDEIIFGIGIIMENPTLDLIDGSGGSGVYTRQQSQVGL